MTRIFSWIFASVLLFFLLDRLGGVLCQYLVDRSEFRYSRLYQGKAESDLLFIGNSRGLIFYEPFIQSLTGKETFNLSYNGMPVDLALVLYQDYLDRYPDPEKVIIDVTLLDRTNPQLVNGFQAYRTHSGRLDSFLLKSVPKSYYAGILSHLYRFNSEVFYRTLVYQSEKDTDWLMNRQINDHLVKTVSSVPEITHTIQPDLVSCLKEILTLSEERGISVELLVNPFYKPYIERMDSFTPWLQQLEQLLGKKIRDYSRLIEDRTGIGDYLHLNKEGAKVYIKQLASDKLFEK